MQSDTLTDSERRLKTSAALRKAPKNARTQLQGYKEYIQQVGLKINALKSVRGLSENRIYYIFNLKARPTVKELELVRNFCVKYGYEEEKDN